MFRKKINIPEVPDSFQVKISADNRFKLFVNEELVGIGPSIGDLQHWNYEVVDLAPYLKNGANTIAVEVWNEGSFKPVNQFSYRTALLIQAHEENAVAINSDESWKVIEDKSFQPIRQSVPGYYAAGAGQYVDMNKAVSADWKKASFDDTNWEDATLIFGESASGFGFMRRTGWQLQQSILPNMELKKERLSRARRSSNVELSKNFPKQPTEVVIPQNKTATILLDQDYLTNAFFSLKFSGGKDALIRLRYSESLYEKDGDRNRSKGNRDEVEDKIFIGRVDSITSNGLDSQEFTTLSYRTYRYVQVEVETKQEPLVVNDVYGTFVGYPFEMKASLDSGSEEMDKIMEIGWRTSRLCAVDTYMDCPFYERLQYVGDTRIQMFVSYYNTGDDRLAKNAINLIDQSRQPDGFTLSRYPDTQNQVIPTYSLWHVSTLYDYMLYGKDLDFVKDKLLGSRQIMNYFISFMDDDGSIKNIPGWNYTDWVPEWSRGTGPMSDDGSSAVLDLQMLHALIAAVELEKNVGEESYMKLYEKYAEGLREVIMSKYWDEKRGLFADTPKKELYSQHANSLAILAGLVDGEKAKGIAKAMLEEKDLAPASIYFSYYLHLALAEAGLGNDYLEWLDVWREYIDLGMTTWGETSQVLTTRSDAHAWGASPNIEFFRIILGIQSAAPQFSKVLIQPNIDDFDKISGTMPHPNGEIKVDYKQTKNGLKADINLPEGVEGTFVWKGKESILKQGMNRLNL
ncbi:MAG: alpha-L-rhamnosidase C-terminal domain-containing protein [Paracoccaceae bacterium]